MIPFVSIKNIEGIPAAYIFSYKKDNRIPGYAKGSVVDPSSQLDRINTVNSIDKKYFFS